MRDDLSCIRQKDCHARMTVGEIKILIVHASRYSTVHNSQPRARLDLSMGGKGTERPNF